METIKEENEEDSEAELDIGDELELRLKMSARNAIQAETGET